ncbi:Rne/Rng family ribonuclease [Pelodictyon phaeoclathratiforme]|jgi:ribonuclease G|uniref:Ribonuclease, Rne/Rng family n=1 Tax=Pelodictyon phaeoclathratiforme (strain DSM 5477 / BU-1) TaxID=324925 RepID=B4SAL3_PELPB|nr:Rne/Rng family ribonuclease [Pelodictyon phaeoclathratiforme]ACF42382.1 ribonuclease, Rne/Rng family [Pelodictyon phaeoclathratiforme BU-1]MBV5288815.1 ribonuclease E/G [Pelodictyon phaeoclathratiforme]
MKKSSNKQLLMNKTGDEIQVALVEEGRLVELIIERPESRRSIGDIYLGRVHKVVEGLKAAFVDIGQKSDGFLHFSDVGTTNEDYRALIEDDDDDENGGVDDGDDAPQGARSGDEPAAGANVKSAARSGSKAPSADDQDRAEKRQSYTQMIAGKLKPNDSILVQVIKEPISSKGSRLTSDITIAGRFMVLLPFGGGQVAVSRRVVARKERSRLKKLVRSMLPEGFGAIIRTVAEDQEETLLKQDLEKLLAKWTQIEEKLQDAAPPQLIFKEDTIISSVLRDSLTSDVTEIVANSQLIYKETLNYIQWAAPEMVKNVTFYQGKLPLFEGYGIAKDVESIFSRKVWLKSGGYIIIEHTEAMVVVDVNSGRYAAKREQEENSLKTNLEAAREVVRQLRLRDIGGIIVVDFIDMLDQKNAKKVYDSMKTELRNDRAKSNILPMSDFGIMQITRERIRPSLMQRMGDQCPACGGTGVVQARFTTINQIERWLRKYALQHNMKFQQLDLYVSPTVVEPLQNSDMKTELKWFLQHMLFVQVKPDESLRSDDFRFYSRKNNKDITAEYGDI